MQATFVGSFKNCGGPPAFPTLMQNGAGPIGKVVGFDFCVVPGVGF